ncbi:hypothetical protein PG990_000074 [Apiospora arundinis]
MTLSASRMCASPLTNALGCLTSVTNDGADLVNDVVREGVVLTFRPDRLQHALVHHTLENLLLDLAALVGYPGGGVPTAKERFGLVDEDAFVVDVVALFCLLPPSHDVKNASDELLVVFVFEMRHCARSRTRENGSSEDRGWALWNCCVDWPSQACPSYRDYETANKLFDVAHFG